MLIVRTRALHSGCSCALMARGLKLAVQGLQLRLRSLTAGDRQLDQAVGEPSVLGQERPVEIGAEEVAPAHTLEPGLAVVPVALDDPSQRRRVRAQIGAAAVVLEAR